MFCLSHDRDQAKLKKQKSETTQIFLFLYLSEQTPLN